MHKWLTSERPHLASVLRPRPIRSAEVLSMASSALVALLFAWTLLNPFRLAAQDAAPAGASAQSSPAATVPLDLSDEVVRDVFAEFQHSMEASDLDHLLGTFDPDATAGFPQIRDQFAAFFRLHENIKFRYQLLQVTADKDVAFATADVEMDAYPADSLPTEQRHSTQMRFQMKRTSKGWRLTGLKPMDFFTL
jgi:ketosteroid isomerase-like protein